MWCKSGKPHNSIHKGHILLQILGWELTLWSSELQIPARCCWWAWHHSDGCYCTADWPATANPRSLQKTIRQRFSTMRILPLTWLIYSAVTHRLSKRTKRVLAILLFSRYSCKWLWKTWCKTTHHLCLLHLLTFTRKHTFHQLPKSDLLMHSPCVRSLNEQLTIMGSHDGQTFRLSCVSSTIQDWKPSPHTQDNSQIQGLPTLMSQVIRIKHEKGKT